MYHDVGHGDKGEPGEGIEGDSVKRVSQEVSVVRLIAASRATSPG